MEVVSNQINKAEVELTVKLSPEDYTSKLTAEIKKYAQKIRIPGFRVGNTAIIRQRYGLQIVSDLVKDTLVEALDQYVKKHQMTLLTDPCIHITEEVEKGILKSKPVTINLPIEVIPDFTVKIENIKVEEYEVIDVNQDDLDAYIDRLKYKHSTLESPGKVKEEDILDLKWVAPDQQEYTMIVVMDSSVVPVVSNWISAKVGDQLRIPFHDLLKVVKNLPKELQEVASEQGEIPLILANIKRIVLPQLDEPLRKTLLEDNGAAPGENFDAYFTGKLRQEMAFQLNTLTKNKIKDQLLEKISIDVPQGYSKEEQEDIRLMLILDAIAKKASIDVPEENVDFQLLMMLKSYLTRFSDKPPKEKELLKLFNTVYPPREKAKYKKLFRLQNLKKKVLPYLKEHITITKRHVSSTEAKKILEKGSLNGSQS